MQRSVVTENGQSRKISVIRLTQPPRDEWKYVVQFVQFMNLKGKLYIPHIPDVAQNLDKPTIHDATFSIAQGGN